MDFTPRKRKPFFFDPFFSLSIEFLLDCIIPFFFYHLPIWVNTKISLLKIEYNEIHENEANLVFVCLTFLILLFNIFIFPSAIPFHLNPQAYQRLLAEIPKARLLYRST